MHQALLTVVAITVLPFVAAEISWDEAYTKARAAVAKISISDQVGLATGQGRGTCVGNNYPVDSIGYRSLRLNDSPLGVSRATVATAFTPSIHAASTWDKELVRQRSQFHGEEAKALGVQVLLGPVADPIGKIPEAGRNWEAWGSDPYLNGVYSAIAIQEMQRTGVQACIKHYIGNEQELNRTTMSSNIDDQTMHEVYLWPYYDAVRAGATSVMCSYNKLDGVWACENDHILNKLLKTELGFPGYVMSDWGAHHTTVLSANSGLDMSMPGSAYNSSSTLWGTNLERAIRCGKVKKERVADMALRILAGYYKTGQDGGYPSVDFTRDVQSNHGENVRKTARDGTFLLKNEGDILPLKRGSGAARYPYFIAPIDAIREKAATFGGEVTQSETDDPEAGAIAAKGKDAVIVFLTSFGTEGRDRFSTLAPDDNGYDLVQAVAEASENVIVVVHAVGPIILAPILKLPSVKAIVWGGLPSQESGNALVDIVWGDVNPSGKLVYTIAKDAADYNTKSVPTDDDFSEGLYIDYRHFDREGIEPEYESGFGLSYTKFEYSDIEISSQARSGPASGDIAPGGQRDLWDEVAKVTAKITNAGKVAGAEAVQLYITLPESTDSPRQLRGFDKVFLGPDAWGTVAFSLFRRDLSVWDVENQSWTIPRGTIVVNVGASSRDLRLEGVIEIA
ncbi:unnamed protein product [Clonostachys rhizophaga]|uniref:Beta-glucosidase cel3A n=1 Tax=Clonostachys rhizophaga TaxID=160324 RepID=A0A9N9VL97_9HYPO|nr:unnamed protein product [Clonostachys rhizophaga]